MNQLPSALERILCIGGGPAGLYFALLMKRRRPGLQITVVERNRPFDTFGWGVVLSDQTLGNLRRADAESAQQIGDAFNHWDDIDTRDYRFMLLGTRKAFDAFSFIFADTEHGPLCRDTVRPKTLQVETP